VLRWRKGWQHGKPSWHSWQNGTVRALVLLMLLALPQTLELHHEQIHGLQLVLRSLQRLQFSLQYPISLLKKRCNVLHAISLRHRLNLRHPWLLRLWRDWSLCLRLCLSLVVVVVQAKWHTELLSQITDLLCVASEAKADRTEVEYSGLITLWHLTMLWLLWVLLLTLRIIVLWYTIGSIWKTCQAWLCRCLLLLLILCWCCPNLDSEGSTVWTSSGSFCAHRGSACRAYLLPLEPAFEAA
jgi:hypothetical protein